MADTEPVTASDWQAVERRVRDLIESELRKARHDSGAYYDLSRAARNLADEITTLWAWAEDDELGRLRARIAELERQRDEVLALCDRRQAAEVPGHPGVWTRDIRAIYGREA